MPETLSIVGDPPDVPGSRFATFLPFIEEFTHYRRTPDQAAIKRLVKGSPSFLHPSIESADRFVNHGISIRGWWPLKRKERAPRGEKTRGAGSGIALQPETVIPRPPICAPKCNNLMPLHPVIIHMVRSRVTACSGRRNFSHEPAIAAVARSAEWQRTIYFPTAKLHISPRGIG